MKRLGKQTRFLVFQVTYGDDGRIIVEQPQL